MNGLKHVRVADRGGSRCRQPGRLAGVRQGACCAASRRNVDTSLVLLVVQSASTHDVALLDHSGRVEEGLQDHPITLGQAEVELRCHSYNGLRDKEAGVSTKYAHYYVV